MSADFMEGCTAYSGLENRGSLSGPDLVLTNEF
jgi:hypothetical protein